MHTTGSEVCSSIGRVLVVLSDKVRILSVVSHGLTGWMESRLPNLKCWMTGNFSRHCERATDKELTNQSTLQAREQIYKLSKCLMPWRPKWMKL